MVSHIKKRTLYLFLNFFDSNVVKLYVSPTYHRHIQLKFLIRPRLMILFAFIFHRVANEK